MRTISGQFREEGIQSKLHVSHGPVVDGTPNAAESEGADLIALASHGGTGLSRIFYGRWRSASCSGQTGPYLLSDQVSRTILRLTLLNGLNVAANIDILVVVVESYFLQLSVGFYQGPGIPKPDIMNCGEYLPIAQALKHSILQRMRVRSEQP